MVQNQLTRGGNMLKYKLDELVGDAGEAASGGRARRQASHRAISGRDRARQYFRHQLRQDGREQCDGAAQIRRAFAAGDFDDQRQDPRRPQGRAEAAGRIPQVAGQIGRKRPGGRRPRDRDVGRRGGDHAGFERDEGGSGVRPATAGGRVRRRHRPHRAADCDAGGRRLFARRGAGAVAGRGSRGR